VSYFHVYENEDAVSHCGQCLYFSFQHTNNEN
jgi:hypothetical protein